MYLIFDKLVGFLGFIDLMNMPPINPSAVDNDSFLSVYLLRPSALLLWSCYGLNGFVFSVGFIASSIYGVNDLVISCKAIGFIASSIYGLNGLIETVVFCKVVGFIALS